MAPEPTTLEGRLHPVSILMVALSMIRVIAVPFAVAMFQAAQGDLFALSPLVLFVPVVILTMVTPIAHWVRYRWRVTPEALEVVSGVLGRQVRRIPLSRIQDVDTSQGIVHRLFGAVALSVHTASTQKAEVELAAVSKADADRLIAALRGVSAAADEHPIAAPPLLRVSTWQLVLRGLTDNRAGLVLASGLAALEGMGEGEHGILQVVYQRFAGDLEMASPVTLALGVLGAVVGFVAVGYVTSVGFNILAFYGFTVALDGDVFRREHGLFTRRAQAMPRERLQALVLHQSPMRRLVNIASLQAHDMGSSTDEASTRRTGSDGFVPAASPDALRALMQVAFPGLDLATLPLRPVSPRMIRRTVTLGVLAALTTLAVGQHLGVSWPLLAFVALLLPPTAWIFGRLAHRRLRVVLDGPFVTVRRGVLWREEVVLPTRRIEAVTLARSPLDRWHGVATVRIVVGGGARFAVHNVAVAEAEAALDQLSLLAD